MLATGLEDGTTNFSEKRSQHLFQYSERTSCCSIPTSTDSVFINTEAVDFPLLPPSILMEQHPSDMDDQGFDDISYDNVNSFSVSADSVDLRNQAVRLASSVDQFKGNYGVDYPNVNDADKLINNHQKAMNILQSGGWTRSSAKSEGILPSAPLSPGRNPVTSISEEVVGQKSHSSSRERIANNSYSTEKIGPLENRRNELAHKTEYAVSFSGISSKDSGSQPFTDPIQKDEQQSNEQPSELEETVPDCDVRRYVVSIGKTLNKDEAQLRPILIRLVCKNWLEDISHLKGLTDSDWTQLEIPKQLMRLLRQHLPDAQSIIAGSEVATITKKPSMIENVVAQITASHTSPPPLVSVSTSPIMDIHGNHVKNASGQLNLRQPLSPLRTVLPSTAAQTANISPKVHDIGFVENSFSSAVDSTNQTQSSTFPGSQLDVLEHNEVEQFLRRLCMKHGRSQAEFTAAVQCLAHDNWFDSIDQLRALTPSQWSVLELPVGLAPLIPAVLAEEQMQEDDSLNRVIIKAGSAMGRTGLHLETAIQRLREQGYHSAVSLQHMTDTEWSNLRLPLRLFEEIQKVINEGLSPSSYGTARSLTYFQNMPQSTTPLSREHQRSYPRLDSVFTDQHPRNTPAKPDPRIVTNKETREARLMTVETFLLKVGLNVGKTEAEMQPIIQKLVKDNWFDSISALRLLKSDEWNALGLPKRLVDEVRRGLSDPFALQLNTVQFTAPEPELFPCDVVGAIWKLEGEISPEALPDTLRSLLKLMETLLCNPFDEAKRIIRKTNNNFQKRAGQYKSGLLVLESVGYVDAGDCYLLPVVFVCRITEAHAALAQVAQLHRDRLARGKKTSKLFSSIK